MDVKFAPFAGAHRRARRGAAVDADERRLQTQLTEALTVSIHLEAFPKAVLEAFVTVLQDDGSQAQLLGERPYGPAACLFVSACG